ncbi:MAG: response regulator [Gammaproteobacteria bacterium]|nr:MAG: response regulator [Gammaproteobacteria bacterium]
MNPAPLARLLIVDDESAQVIALCRTLALEGYATAGAGSGPEALCALRAAAADRAGAFDVLITDLMMKDMNGIALLRAAQDIDPDLVGLVMTGDGTIDTAIEAMKSGALDYILKPFTLRTIRPVLLRALAVRRLRLENAQLLRRVANRTTELEAANRELQRANKELEAFTYSVSHDLRQPLNGMIGFTEFLVSEKPGPLNASQKEFLGNIHRGGQQLLRLTNDLLNFSRLGQQPLKRETVNVGTLVLEILHQLRDAEPPRNVELRVSALPDARADSVLLRQVLVNLLSNAFKFTRHVPNPVIEVDGREQAGECAYSIRDNGAGFDMRNAQRLFAIFHRLHSDRHFEGNGVGLSIAQRIVERHGGRIWAEAAVGQGAKFTFTLPA